MAYEPSPIDTSGVELPDDLEALVEQLARHNHEVWALGRMGDGWTWGPARDDDARRHPDLVPYDELSEAEMAYDREAVVGTLKAVLALGGAILPPGAPAQGLVPKDARANLLQGIERAADVRAALALWGAHDPEVWGTDPRPYRRLAERLIGFGAYLVAFDVVQEGLRLRRDDVRLRQLEGLALARFGAARAARAGLEALRAEGHEDLETLGMLARTHKDLGLSAADSDRRRAHLERSYDVYVEAHERSGGDYWTGINAATLAVLLGRADDARRLAHAVRDRCLPAWETLEGEGEAYWLSATLGEASLVLGEEAEAARWYREAMRVGGRRWGDVASTRRNAALLLDHLALEHSSIEACFELPRVVVFAGHMIDRPDRPRPRFPSTLEPFVREAIAGKLDALDPAIAYASAACGSDILFLEETQRRGWDTYAVLPYDREAFAGDSVDIVPDGDWRQRYDRVLERATEVSVASTQRLRWGSASYEYANTVLLGLACLRARGLGAPVHALSVWDGTPGDGPGGTAWNVNLWRKRKLPCEVIDLEAMRRRHAPGAGERASPTTTPPRPAPEPLPDGFGAEVKTLLFADARHFSALTEWQVPVFVNVVMGVVGDLARSSPFRPVLTNTWGDGLYMVFDGVGEAGRFALELSRRIEALDHRRHGLPESLVFRVGLHAGPVYQYVDPVTGRPTYGGTHVSRTARIEPIVPPGEVYASQWFAALAELEAVEDFTCDYAGIASLAKDYGPMPVFRLRSRPA